MAFSLFGKRTPDSETTDEGNDLKTGRESSATAPEKRGFFDRMRQAVTRTRTRFRSRLGRCWP